jgi:hypothetical protein
MTETAKYFEGAPCVACGSVVRYKSDRKCVPCRLNRKRMGPAPAPLMRLTPAPAPAPKPKPAPEPKTRRKPGTLAPPVNPVLESPMSRRLSKAQDSYYNLPIAKERSKHLDRLIRQRFAVLLGEAQP